MDYRTGSLYEAQSPMYRQQTAQSHHHHGSGGGGGSSLYPRLGQQQNPNLSSAPRIPSFHHSSPSPSSSSSGLGIRVAIKPEYRITPPPQLSPQVGDIPRSTFQFDFELERRILAEAEKETPNWGRLGLENLPLRRPESTSSSGHGTDPVINKYIAMGLNREAVPFAVANYGDSSTKVHDFVRGYNTLREMGFSSTSVVEALVTYENDTEKALAHFLNNST